LAASITRAKEKIVLGKKADDFESAVEGLEERREKRRIHKKRRNMKRYTLSKVMLISNT